VALTGDDMLGSAPTRVDMSGPRELVVLSLDRPSGRGSFFDAACPVLDAMARFQKALGMVEASYCDLFSFRDRSRDRPPIVPITRLMVALTEPPTLPCMMMIAESTAQ
jgi:hypothetical protein